MSDFEQEREEEPQGAALPEPTFKTERVTPTTKSEGDRTGGFAFFLSLAALCPSGLILIYLAFSAVESIDTQAFAVFGAAWIMGIVLGHSIIRGHASVYIHESKHAIVSNLVGNKRKGMKIDANSGHFTYSYTKKTAHFNALIALAPYILPVFTFLAAIVAFALFREDHLFAALVLGFGFGVDTALNVRDISPIQTDINTIKGGYGIGLLYIFSWNLVIFAVLLTWVFGGKAGLTQVLHHITEAFMRFYASLSRGAPEP